MFLKLFRSRILGRVRTVRESSERGVALITAIGIMAVFVIITSVVLGASVSAAGFSTSTRANVQAEAAANAGIEAVRAQMLGGSFPCTLNGTAPTFSATVAYETSTGASYGCGTTDPATAPVTATIISTGTAAGGGVGGNTSGNTVVEGADVAIVMTPGGLTLNQALFSNGSLSLNNGDSIDESEAGLYDGNIYANGSITCPSDGTIEGTVYAQGGLTFQNSNCESFGTVWVNGAVTVPTVGAAFAGSIFSTGSVSLGDSFVGGNVISNGTISMASEPNKSGTTTCSSGSVANVCGSVFSLDGGITFNSNGASSVQGSAYAESGVALGGSSGGPGNVGQNVVSLSGGVSGYGTIAGTVESGGPVTSTPTRTSANTCAPNIKACATGVLAIPLPTNSAPSFAVQLPMFSPANGTNLGTSTELTQVVAPPVQPMPEILTSKQSTLASQYSQWIADGWTTYQLPAADCSTSNGVISSDLKTQFAKEPAGTRLVIDTSLCTSGIDMNNSTLAIPLSTSNVTSAALILSSNASPSSSAGFNNQSSPVQVTSTDGAGHTFMMIVPTFAAPNAPTGCTSGGSQINTISAEGVTTGSGDQVFIYSPCMVSIQNGGSFTGQIYSGSASYPTSMQITIPSAANLPTVPGITVPGGGSSSASYSATITSRFNVSG